MKACLLYLVLVFAARLPAEALYYGAQSIDVSQNQFCALHVTLPQVQGANAAVADALNQHFKSELETYRTDYGQDVTHRCADEATANRLRVSFFVYSPLDTEIISVVIIENREAGGEHANRFLRTETFAASTGEFFSSVGDFLKDGALEPFKDMVEAKLQNSVPGFDAEAGWKTLRAGWTSFDEVATYAIEPEGLTIFFNDYEIAPYDAGQSKITLEWDDLKQLGLKSTGPAAALKILP